jgi:integrase
MNMTRYNATNERIKKAYFRYLKEAGRKADSTVEGIRKAISRFEIYTRFKDFRTFNKEQAIGFKKHLANGRSIRSGEPMAKSTLLATTNALKDFLKWLSCQPGYKSRIRFTDIEYFNLSEKETRAAKAPKFKTYPTFEQIRAALAMMPTESEVEQRNRALLAFAALTGIRVGALASLHLKHVDLARELVIQDPREVRTKRSKRIDTYFCPVGDDFKQIVIDWIRYLREKKLFGDDDPLFPRTQVSLGKDGQFASDGLEPRFWQNTEPIRKVFREAFANCGLKGFHPHSFRDTLVKFGERHAPSIEHFKAWSQNLGHEHMGTTLTSYGIVDPHQQGELVRAVVPDQKSDAETRALFDQFVRMFRRGATATEVPEFQRTG